MRAPIRFIRGRWSHALESRFSRLFWADPLVISRGDATPEQFRTAMSALHVGSTIKITGTNRHPLADGLILGHVDLRNAHIVDIGASDGSTSVDLIRQLPNFGRYTIADLYFHLEIETVGRHTLIYGPDGTLILIVGRRLLAWPSLSRGVALLYRPVTRRAGRDKAARQQVLLLNPDAQALMAKDPRVSYQVHDIFQPWSGDRPTLIKVANLLRRLYFADEQISQAVERVLADLPDGGYLLIVDNPRISGIAERAGLYRREADHFVLVEQTPNPPEIGELVLNARSAA